MFDCFVSALLQRQTAREVAFVIPAGAELLIDDVLLYEPGRK
jgi:hypothetical protein